MNSSVIDGRNLTKPRREFSREAPKSQSFWVQATRSFDLRVKGNDMRNTNARMVGARSVDTRYIQNASRSAAVLFQGKWRVEILCAMRSEPVRVGQLSRLIPGSSKKMLAHNLRQLEADGIVLRRDMSDMVLHVEYDFANEARDEVCSLLDHLAQWGEWMR